MTIILAVTCGLIVLVLLQRYGASRFGATLALVAKVATAALLLVGLVQVWINLTVPEGAGLLYWLLLLLPVGYAALKAWPSGYNTYSDRWLPMLGVVVIGLVLVFWFHSSQLGADLRASLHCWQSGKCPGQKTVATAPVWTPARAKLVAPKKPASIVVPKCANGWKVLELHRSWGDVAWRPLGIRVQYRNGSTWFSYTPGTMADADAYRFCTNNFFGGRSMLLYWSETRPYRF